QEADLAGELDAVLAVLDEPADDEPADGAAADDEVGKPTGGYAGEAADETLGEPPGERAGGLGAGPLGGSWMTGLGGVGALGPGAGFGDGGVLDGLGPGPALAGFCQAVLDDCSPSLRMSMTAMLRMTMAGARDKPRRVWPGGAGCGRGAGVVVSLSRRFP